MAKRTLTENLLDYPPSPGLARLRAAPGAEQVRQNVLDMQRAAMVEASAAHELELPDFLRLTPEQRADGWAKAPPPRPHAKFIEERPVTPEVRAILDEQAAEKRTRSQNRIARMLAKKEDHTGKTWDSRIARWVDINPRGATNMTTVNSAPPAGGKPTNKPAAGATTAKKPAPAPAAKKPAPKPAPKKAATDVKKEIVPKTKKVPNAASDARRIKILTAENKYREGYRKEAFDLLRPDMTVGEFMEAAAKKAIPSLKARTALRVYRNDKRITL